MEINPVRFLLLAAVFSAGLLLILLGHYVIGSLISVIVVAIAFAFIQIFEKK